ncbi:SDR family oxidoreductase [Paraburkholderia sp. C35]|uniref:SDR family NAD(P)-dependent oxidoreductase n=1 Tax=Paraburkholderia sp. C35 TaxID=2126993 RepID=UPI000D6859D8|nr:SDR family oxidoreductase [Paraburkholderia sp. C35]
MAKILEGKVALVTGGSRGIGAATASQLAAQGATVVLSYASSEARAAEVVAAIEASGGKALAVKADQANASAVKTLIADVVRRFGKLDILVNNAAVFETGTVAETTDTSGFDRQLQINYEAVVTAIREASRVMESGGRIISISSALALRSTWPGLADYSATKRAIEGYSKGVARDLGPKGITVNVIGAGSTNTEMNPDDSPFAEAQAAATALGRFGRPEEIAAAVTFIASPAASFITGAVIPVDGGYSA